VGIQILFLIFAALAVLGGLGVIASREPIKSVLSLVGTMLSLAVLFLLLSAQFVFVVQIIVYAGAVMVLFLFVVALLGPIKERRTGRLRFHWGLSLLAALVFLGFLGAMLQGIRYHTPQQADLNVFGTVEQIGAGLYGPYLFPFELTSILLVVAAVGAIYLSRGGREPGEQNGHRPHTSLKEHGPLGEEARDLEKVEKEEHRA
jgi:NADH-quinone oxidoreductase subunit J